MRWHRKVAEGGTISDSERETLEKLLALSRSLCGQLATVSMHLDNGTLELEQARAALSEGGEGVQALSLSKSFADTEQALADYPTLIYDGPFSDHINQKNPAMLHGKGNITREEAAQIASKFSGIAANNLQEDSDEDGNMASYGFFYDTMSISITKAGGYLCYMLNSRFADEATLNATDAISRASAFFATHGPIKTVTAPGTSCFTARPQAIIGETDAGICGVRLPYTLRIMAIQIGQQQLVRRKSSSERTNSSKSSASFSVRISANSATSTIPEKPRALKAERSLPGVTSAENWPRKAGAMRA